jgi:putative N6-adenine-specific DNA methylase
MGDWLKQKCAGWSGYIFTSGKDLMGSVGLKTARRIPFQNADIDCRLLRYDIHIGSKNKPAPPTGDDDGHHTLQDTL